MSEGQSLSALWLLFVVAAILPPGLLYLGVARVYDARRRAMLASVERAKAHLTPESILSSKREGFGELLAAGKLLQGIEDACAAPLGFGEPLLWLIGRGPQHEHEAALRSARALLTPSAAQEGTTESGGRLANGLLVMVVVLAIVIGAFGLRWTLHNTSELQYGAIWIKQRWINVSERTTATFLGCCIYGVAFLGARWHLLVRPMRSTLLTRIESAMHRAWTDQSSPEEIQPIERLGLYQASLMFVSARAALAHATPLDIIFWSRGQEARALALYKSANAILIESWDHPRLLRVMSRWRTQIEIYDAPTPPTAAPRASTDPDDTKGTSTRQEAQRVYERLTRLEMRAFEVAQDVQSKAMWALIISLLAIVVASYMALLPVAQNSRNMLTGNEIALLCGAMGGLMSRIYRLRGASQDHGALPDWGALFLSPPIGALSAYIGLIWLEQLGELKLVGETLTSWTAPGQESSTYKLASLAILLGFSETFFVNTARRLDGSVSAALSPRGDKAQQARASSEA